MRHLFLLILVTSLLSLGSSRAAEANSKPVTLSGPDALDRTIQKLAGDLTNQLQAADQRAQKVAAASDGLSTSIWIAAGVLAGIVMLSKLLPILANHFGNHHTSLEPSPMGAGDSANRTQGFSQFVEIFAASQKGVTTEKSFQATDRGVGRTKDQRPEYVPASERAVPVRRDSAEQVVRVRRLFSRLSRASSQDARKQGMANLLEATRLLRESLEGPTAHSARQLASALEALLGEITNHEERATASGLRTIAGAIDLLPGLCGPGVRPDLTTKPVVRLLGVDDDAISRYTLTCALKRHFAQPDLAVSGEDALHLTETRPYDLIFVDIEMPGMDGFELCSRIHKTPFNQSTPVVFVTGHNDLTSRAKSSVAGGVEFLGKPFLGSELTVKALSLVLKRRLQADQRPAAAERPVPQKETPVIQPMLQVQPS